LKRKRRKESSELKRVEGGFSFIFFSLFQTTTHNLKPRVELVWLDEESEQGDAGAVLFGWGVAREEMKREGKH